MARYLAKRHLAADADTHEIVRTPRRRTIPWVRRLSPDTSDRTIDKSALVQRMALMTPGYVTINLRRNNTRALISPLKRRDKRVSRPGATVPLQICG
ncbi:hypothetical protein KB20921_13950 [Edwardsiella ictaluri]|nr:hypothetical protein KH20906_13680 [Edwardsiella ictaluri]BEI02134.1 hypothetical protein KB20921_13950 [Edwardsiella ictaluri]BEI05603.1 hypothetical protein KH201010_13890 [Edwardsiella ictaluri]BEI09059.1 hypothetical protein STU22726_13900 [Edwardsiella ictaluri]BEI12539.1 hypothetical protein STU22816_13920 [Edwardsiella ictaluri]